MAGDEGETTPPRVAIIGCGSAGQMHADALERAGMTPAALIDPDPGRRVALGRPWPGVVLASSLDEVANVFDAAIVAAPDVVHPAMAIELLHAGKHVLVEKPMAGTRAEADAMVAAATSTGQVLAVAQVRRHLAVIAWAFDVLRSGALGDVERVDAAQGGLDNWLAASSGHVKDAIGGVIADQGAHVIDVLAWWFGPLDVVSCADDACGGQEADATVELVAGVIPVHLELSRLRRKRNTIRIHAERGLLEVALDHFQPRQMLAVPDGLGIAPFVEVADSFERQFDAQLRAFTEAIDGRWSPLLATAADGAEVARVIEDCYACRSSHELWWMRSAVARS